MPRVAIPVTVLDATGIPLLGKSVTVRKRSDNSLATIFTTETGGTTASNPLSTDAQGRVTGWVDRNAYKLTITGSGITTYDEQFDAMPASDAGIDAAALGAAILPLGFVGAYGGATDPAGGNWLICDGRALSRTTYSGLFGIAGTGFGVGDGSTTFNIPDLKGRVPLGAGVPANPSVAGGTIHTLGAKGGEESHVIASAEYPDHAHRHTSQIGLRSGLIRIHDPNNALLTLGGSSYAHYDNPGPINGYEERQGADVSYGLYDSNSAERWQVTSTGKVTEGAATAHNNLPAFTVTNFIIRAL